MPRSWVGWLNFLVLQWFFVRLARTLPDRLSFVGMRSGDGPIRIAFTGKAPPGINSRDDYYVAKDAPAQRWKVLRYIVPLTGWWSRFIYIWRRP
jgi:hypothetical protein